MSAIVVTYTDPLGEERKLMRHLSRKRWTGEDEDEELVWRLNNDLTEWLGRHHYFPHPWHEAKAVADKLGGTLDAPEPKIESDPGRIY